MGRPVRWAGVPQVNCLPVPCFQLNLTLLGGCPGKCLSSRRCDIWRAMQIGQPGSLPGNAEEQGSRNSPGNPLPHWCVGPEKEIANARRAGWWALHGTHQVQRCRPTTNRHVISWAPTRQHFPTNWASSPIVVALRSPRARVEASMKGGSIITLCS